MHTHRRAARANQEPDITWQTHKIHRINCITPYLDGSALQQQTIHSKENSQHALIAHISGGNVESKLVADDVVYSTLHLVYGTASTGMMFSFQNYLIDNKIKWLNFAGALRISNNQTITRCLVNAKERGVKRLVADDAASGKHFYYRVG